jgi:Carbohydrate family 9 binding domain-like
MNALLLLPLALSLAPAADPPPKPVIGLIPKATKAITLDGKLDDWDGAFVAPVHVGHPDFANRGAHVLFLWDEQNLYVGLRCLDTKPAHTGPDNQVWNGDAVEFYLDTRRGDDLGGAKFGDGTLHVFWTPFTGTEVKPRMQVRDIPELKDFKLQGAEVAGAKTPWGYTAEFKLPWAHFPKFTPKAGEVLGLDVELCSGDGGLRTDRTFVYSSPAAVGSPSAFGRVQLVDKLDPAKLEPYSRALLPLAVTQTGNYEYVYATACVSPTLDPAVAKFEAKLLDAKGMAFKPTAGNKQTLEGSGLVLWKGQWELFDLPPGSYTLELTALAKDGTVLAKRTAPVAHGEAAKQP